MTTEMNIEKVRDEMAEHWDMDAATFDAHKIDDEVMHTGGWLEVSFADSTGKPVFYIEVNADDEVWHFDWIQ